MKLLETVNLIAGYKKAKNIVREINLVIEEGEFIGLFGTNGAGKSTILKAIRGILYQQEGSILYNQGDSNETINITNYSPAKRSRLGIKYLTQDARIFSNFTVKENLLFAVNFDKSLYDEKIDSIFNVFPDMKENHFLDKRGSELSGGQREKTAIAMVLITNPRLLMLDEPSTGLSPNLVESLLKGIRDCQKNQVPKMGIILIEQQKLFEAKYICDSLYLLKNGNIVDIEGKQFHEKLPVESVTNENLENFMLVEA
jgi:ABC-type branched-subunit amino acid transport system ATPase component